MLRFSHPDWVPMQIRQSGRDGTSEIRLHDLGDESLRMRPSRIIVGEVSAEGLAVALGQHRGAGW